VTAIPAAAAPQDPSTDWPADDTVILRSRTLRQNTPPSKLSRFCDAVWILQPAHADDHHVVNSVRWQRFPDATIPVFKTFVLAALDHPYPPVLAVDRRSQRMAVDTISLKIRDLRVFAQWMNDNGLRALSQVSSRDLDAYRSHVLALSTSQPRKAELLRAVRLLWGYRDLLPEPCRLPEAAPWGGASGNSLAKVQTYAGGNRTPRIDEATMESLLGWSLRMLEDFGPDIADAWQEYRQLNTATHPSQERFHGLSTAERLELFLADARRKRTPLPGSRSTDGRLEVNAAHMARLLGLSTRGLSDRQFRRAAESGLPITEDAYIGVIRGKLDGNLWRDQPITVGEIQTLVRFLTAACFVIVCYLSGLRPGEALNLRRGCRDVDADTGQLLLVGRAGKGADRAPAGQDLDELTRPWVVVAPVHAAIEMLERLTDHPLVFPASHVRAQARRDASGNARASRYMTRDLEQYAAWVNTTFAIQDGGLPIPPDPTKHIHPRRFRRTLAYFIVRRPRGLIAAALQYGHVNTRVTLSYSGTADTGWMEDLAVERLELILEQTDQDWNLLKGDEHVSGPSAAEYRDRVARTRRFDGRVVRSARNLDRLLASTDPGIHHGRAMTCVWRAETAACRAAKIAEGLPADNAPDESECRTNCPNLAYTDRDIHQVSLETVEMRQRADDPLAPRPIRDRAAARADRLQEIVDRHEATRPTLTSPARQGNIP
jgi:integrase